MNPHKCALSACFNSPCVQPEGRSGRSELPMADAGLVKHACHGRNDGLAREPLKGLRGPALSVPEPISVEHLEVPKELEKELLELSVSPVVKPVAGNTICSRRPLLATSSPAGTRYARRGWPRDPATNQERLAKTTIQMAHICGAPPAAPTSAGKYEDQGRLASEPGRSP